MRKDGFWVVGPDSGNLDRNLIAVPSYLDDSIDTVDLFAVGGCSMPIREQVDRSKLNKNALLPHQLRLIDFETAMQDVYDFFYDVNVLFQKKGLPTFDDELRPAIMSGMLSDMLTASLAKHSRALTPNHYHNGHPDLIVKGRFANDSVKSGGLGGVEIKTTQKAGGAVDTHGAREQHMCVFVYEVDKVTQPAQSRKALRFREVYIGHVVPADFRGNERGQLGTRTATLDRYGILKLRNNWVYKA